MKKVAITGEKQAELIDAEMPRAAGDWAVVKVLCTPMCTEYKSWVSGHKSEFLGHEAAGEVVETAGASSVKVGDRVVITPINSCGVCSLCISGDFIHCESTIDRHMYTGGREGGATYAQHLICPARVMNRVPADFPIEKAALACCAIGPSFGAFDRLGLDSFDTVLITGLGPVGLGAVVNARFRGSRVIGVEGIPWRAERARQLGAEVVLNPADPDLASVIRGLTGGRGVDKALDCSGVTAAHRLCIDATRRRGAVAFIGESWADLPIKVSDDLIRKGLTIHGSWHFNRNLFPKVLDVIRRSPVIDQLVSHRFPMSRVQEAFEASASHESAKILLDPWA